jgi:hypothetical protein
MNVLWVAQEHLPFHIIHISPMNVLWVAQEHLMAHWWRFSQTIEKLLVPAILEVYQR